MYAQRDSIPALDGVRAIAALMVVHGHLPDWATIFPTAWGGLSVNVFFCLSGFLITRGLLANRGTPGALPEFWKRRFLRIVPPLALVVAVFALVRPDLGTLAAGTYWYNFYAPYDHTLHPLRHTWSLSIEEQFYAIWPLIILFMPVRRASGLLIAAIVAPAVFVLGYNYLATQNEHWDEIIFRFTWFQGCYLATGALIAIYEVEIRSRPIPYALIGLGLAVLGSLIYKYPVLHFGPQYWFWALFVAPGLFLIALGLAGMKGIGNQILAFGPLVAVGRVSYGLYLYHLPIFWAFDTENAKSWTPIILAAALTALAVTISWRLIEKPALRLKSFSFRKSAKASA